MSGGRSGRVVHFEIPYDDAERARTFYAEAFGWSIDVLPSLDYTVVTTGPSDETGPLDPGYVNGGMAPRDAPLASPAVVVEVDDIDVALARVEELGGRTVLARTQVGDIGWSAYVTDTEGNVVGLWQGA
jgi:predicted enzyme related to lactoylglutathione lyase